VLLDSPNGVATDDETRACVQSTADLLSRLGHHVEETTSPVGARFADDFSLYWALLGLLVTTTGRRVIDPGFDATRTDDLTRGLARMCRRRMARTPGMLYRLRRTAHEYRKVFTRLDVVLSPVLSHTTPAIGHLSPTLPFEALCPRLQAYVGFTPLNNASGGPAISLPLGATASGLPMGCQLAADLGDERTLLELGFELEAARPWSRIQDARVG
jgi:amidase